MLENIHKSLYCQSFGGVCLFISVLTCLVVSYLWLVYISNHKQPHVRFIVPWLPSSRFKQFRLQSSFIVFVDHFMCQSKDKEGNFPLTCPFSGSRSNLGMSVVLLVRGKVYMVQVWEMGRWLSGLFFSCYCDKVWLKGGDPNDGKW